ncbi:LysE family translocator [Schumannella sp. 10F1B-5-1]|uniref:LysE family translocator n=1 Tax=Schumannella sp. 10F1B-5-1 TaxID=2590780 RepID=UPI001131BB13|nr:LysE family translocator [Schumannella sp. 10F1B-5-1]TPW76958.1 LysE family translocator [Schumannella sp. 10F1B-5-1]
MIAATLVPVLLTYAIGTASPGPANMSIMTVAARDGRRPALTFAAGVLLGGLTWAILAATGITALLTSFAEALTVLKVLGGAYLLYLAAKSAISAIRSRDRSRSQGRGARPDHPAPAEPPVSNFVQLHRGYLLHLTNPKGILVWAATMSIGLHPGAEPWMPVLIVACCEVCGILIFGAYALLFSLAPIARLYRRATRIVEAAVAVVFAAFGVRLLLSPLRV